ncbi:hypothetical protein D3C79_748490 [compost metagenome]
MEILEITYKGKKLEIPYEVDQSEIKKINPEYFVYGKSGEKYTFRQYYKRWELVDSVLPEPLANAIIDSLINRYEKKMLAVCYYDGIRQIISIDNQEYTAQDYAYSLMVNNIDLGSLKWSKQYGWDHDLRVNLNAQWFGTPEVEIITQMIENGEIPWVKTVPIHK